MRSSRLLFRQAASLFAAVLLMAACGGGGGSGNDQATVAQSSSSAQSYPVQTYVTDNLATEYSKVWVTLKKITAVDASGAEVTLFDAGDAPRTLNLSSLADVGLFMSTVSLPAGLYGQIKVTLGNAVQLVSLDGSTTLSAKFNATGTDFVWTVRDVSLDPSTAGQLVLDFNLAKFDYDASTGIVTPVVERVAATDAFRKFTRQQAEVRGTLTAVNSAAGTLTLNDTYLGTSVVVTLASDATLVNSQTGAALTLADLLIGDLIEAKGTVTPGATTADPATVTTSVVNVLRSGTTLAGTRLTGSGTVLSIAGQKVTVSLVDANFLPSGNSVVVDIGTATFAHGLASDLAVGLSVQFSGVASGTGADAFVQASVFNIDGAPSASKRTGSPALRFSGGLRGSVASVSSSTSFTVTVTAATTFAAAGTYTVDASQAVYGRGSAACLVVGANVTVLGTLTGTAVVASEVDISGCGGQSYSRPGR